MAGSDSANRKAPRGKLGTTQTTQRRSVGKQKESKLDGQSWNESQEGSEKDRSQTDERESVEARRHEEARDEMGDVLELCKRARVVDAAIYI